MKIASLFPAGSEIICNLGLSKSLIAVSHECDFPPLLSKKAKVTKSIIPKCNDQNIIDQLVKDAIKNNVSLYQIDNNRLLKMNPDLIITQGLCEVCSISENQIQATLKNNLCTLSNKTKIMSLNATTFDEICDEIIMIGKEVNKVRAAENLVKKAYQRKDNLLQRKINKKILLLEWIDPYFSPGHWIPEQIEMAGFEVCLGKKGKKSVELSVEEINNLNPDYIGLICCGYNLEENKYFAKKVYEDTRIKNLDAIKNEQVFAFDSNSYFSRPSLRILDGAEQLRDVILNNDKKYHCERIY